MDLYKNFTSILYLAEVVDASTKPPTDTPTEPPTERNLFVQFNRLAFEYCNFKLSDPRELKNASFTMYFFLICKIVKKTSMINVASGGPVVLVEMVLELSAVNVTVYPVPLFAKAIR